MQATADKRQIIDLNGGGRPWRLRVGGVTVQADPAPPGLRLGVPAVVEPFLADDAEPRVCIRVDVGDLRSPGDEELLFDSGGPWQLYRSQGGYLFRISGRDRREAPSREAWFAPDFREGRVTLQAGSRAAREPVYPLTYPLDELLFIHLLSSGLGIEVHACGVVPEDGGALLLAGQSGDGKSTTARLWQREAPAARVLSDDRIILREEEGTIWAYGTPWHGDAKVALPERAPLRRIYFLRHGSENRLRALEKAEAAALLLARSFLPFYSKEGMSESLAVAERIAAQVPAQMFEFVPDGRAVAFVRQQGTA